MIKNILNVVEIDRTRKVVERRGETSFYNNYPNRYKDPEEEGFIQIDKQLLQPKHQLKNQYKFPFRYDLNRSVALWQSFPQLVVR